MGNAGGLGIAHVALTLQAVIAPVQRERLGHFPALDCFAADAAMAPTIW